MNTDIKNPKLILEENKAVKLFLCLFYLFFILYDIYYNYIYPLNVKDVNSGGPNKGLGIWLYIIIFALLPVAIYFIKKGNPYIVKYIYIVSYILIDMVDNLLIYLGTTNQFAAGNIVEVFFVLFSPIFVNKKYFWIVSLGMIGKYMFFWIILQDSFVMFPILINFVLAAIAFVLLIRFFSYIKSLTSVHEELRQKEKLAVIGQMAAAIGHEIRNPLSSLRGFTQLQQERFPNSNDFSPIMIQEIDRINSIVNDLMYLGKPKTIQFVKANIEEIIEYTLSITQQQAESRGVTIETIMVRPLLPFDCEREQLKQVFINLIKNAIESMQEGGKIQIDVRVLEEKMVISIQDEGCGISEKNISNIGEPFYTTKTDGTGLGLMVSNQIIKDHRGELNFQSNLEKGTKVEVILPITQK